MRPDDLNHDANGLGATNDRDAANVMRWAAVQAHEPARPTWRCAACDEEWPCRRRRALLRAESGGSKLHLALLLARYYAEATQERPDIAPAVFHVRFLGWFNDTA
ncbi:MAG TPA: hypothetical protein VH561_00485 [Micromonosporaceae bacterium]|jgi:hypothetical protein